MEIVGEPLTSGSFMVILKSTHPPSERTWLNTKSMDAHSERVSPGCRAQGPCTGLGTRPPCHPRPAPKGCARHTQKPHTSASFYHLSSACVGFRPVIFLELTNTKKKKTHHVALCDPMCSLSAVQSAWLHCRLPGGRWVLTSTSFPLHS